MITQRGAVAVLVCAMHAGVAGGQLRPAAPARDVATRTDPTLPAPALVPWPSQLTQGAGSFVITAQTAIVADGATRVLARELAGWLAPATGFDLEVRRGAPRTGAIALARDTALARTLGAEGYQLEVTRHGVTIRAATTAGVFYGMQSLRQLLPPDIHREAPAPGMTWTLPVVSITDVPRFGWRGAHLDVSRHFMPKQFVKRYIDLLAMHKLNRFHWHLTDDQGWRLEIKQYPLLTQVGGWRRETLVGSMRGDSANRVFDWTLTGQLFHEIKNPAERVSWMFFIGGVLILSGLCWDIAFPITIPTKSIKRYGQAVMYCTLGDWQSKDWLPVTGLLTFTIANHG